MSLCHDPSIRMKLLTPETLKILCDIADAAGREIMDVYQNGGESWQKDDLSPLTEADLRADRVIRESLTRHFPNIFIWSEESISQSRVTEEENFFLVDPLDGTKEFLKKNGEFTVNIAWIEAGQAVAGVVFAPALNEMFFALKGSGAFKRDSHGIHAIATSKHASTSGLRIMGSRSHGSDMMNDWLSTITDGYTFIAAGSSLKFCRIAEGQADIYPRFGLTSQWDTAAAQAVLEVAGGVVTDLQRQPLSYGLKLPVLNHFFVAVGDVNLLELI